MKMKRNYVLASVIATALLVVVEQGAAKHPDWMNDSRIPQEVRDAYHNATATGLSWSGSAWVSATGAPDLVYWGPTNQTFYRGTTLDSPQLTNMLSSPQGPATFKGVPWFSNPSLPDGVRQGYQNGTATGLSWNAISRSWEDATGIPDLVYWGPTNQTFYHGRPLGDDQFRGLQNTGPSALATVLPTGHAPMFLPHIQGVNSNGNVIVGLSLTTSIDEYSWLGAMQRGEGQPVGLPSFLGILEREARDRGIPVGPTTRFVLNDEAKSALSSTEFAEMDIYSLNDRALSLNYYYQPKQLGVNAFANSHCLDSTGCQSYGVIGGSTVPLTGQWSSVQPTAFRTTEGFVVRMSRDFPPGGKDATSHAAFSGTAPGSQGMSLPPTSIGAGLTMSRQGTTYIPIPPSSAPQVTMQFQQNRIETPARPTVGRMSSVTQWFETRSGFNPQGGDVKLLPVLIGFTSQSEAYGKTELPKD